MGRSKPVTLIAGGAGFIGSHLCLRLLGEGHEVICVDNLQTALPSNLGRLKGRPGFTFVEADIVQPLPEAVTARAGEIGRVYNLACPASPPLYQIDPEHTMLTNVVGTNNLLRLAENSGARFFLASTSEVYGDPEVHPQQEDYRGWVNCTGPRACYDEGKRAAETLTFDYARTGRAEVRVIRIFNTYGPHMSPDDGRVVSNMLCQAIQGDDITIYGDGTQTRSFCYVSDMVDGFVRLMEAEIDGTEPVNIGNPVELSMQELADEIVRLTGARSRIVYRPLPIDDPRRRRPDIERAKALLGWEPRVTLREGLTQTYHWFAEELGRAERVKAA
jgi:UDP-glucuronate decarboxylase